MSIRTLRGVAAALSLAATALASSAGAQTVTAAYAPSCGLGTPCSVVRFTLGNTTSSTLLFDGLTLTSSGSPFVFDPVAGGAATFQAEDVFGPFSGFGTVNVGGTSFAIDFVNGSGFQLQLDPGTFGYVEAALASTPSLPRSGAFSFSASIDGAPGPITGAVTSTPEPATFVLVAGGLALVGVAARRRRA